MEIPIKIKVCKKFGSSENKFGLHRYTCTKCRSKDSNLKNNEKRNYFPNYYQKNKEAILIHSYELYHTKYKKSLKNTENLTENLSN